ncbi:MAG: transposase [Beijerinckiaceae bacterium]
MLKYKLMSDEYQRIEIINGTGRRRRWTAAQKLRMVEETWQTGESLSEVARRNGVVPNLLYRWRKLMSEGGAVAVPAELAELAPDIWTAPRGF